MIGLTQPGPGAFDPTVMAIAIFLAGAILYLYLLPALIAKQCRHTSFRTILLLNLLLGWTFIVWIVVMFWANGELIWRS